MQFTQKTNALGGEEQENGKSSSKTKSKEQEKERVLTLFCQQGPRFREPQAARVAGCFQEEDCLHWSSGLCHALPR